MDFIESYKNSNNSANQINNNANIKDSKEYKDLENLLSEEKNKNNFLNYKIKELEKDLYSERETNKKLLSDNNYLNNQILNVNKKIIDLNNQISCINIMKNNKITELQNIINMKDQQINQLNSRNNNINNANINLMPGESFIGIGFTSVNQKIQNFVGAYKDTEIFVRIEEKLYDEYPEFKDKETYFMHNGNKVKRFRTLKENNINNGAIIQVHIYGEEL